MSGFIEGEDRHQATLFPESLDEYIAEDSTVRVIDVFIDDLNISGLGFKTEPSGIGRPGGGRKNEKDLYRGDCRGVCSACDSGFSDSDSRRASSASRDGGIGG